MKSTKIQNPKSKIQNRQLSDLRPGESVVLLQRQHPAILFRNLLWPLSLLFVWLVSLFLVIPFISSLQITATQSQDGSLSQWLPFGVWVAWVAFAVILTLWSVYVALDWSDHWVALTTHRLIMMNKTFIFRETRSEAPLANVQNVSAEYPNNLSVALDFGNLYVDTSGIGLLTFKNMPRPKAMKEAIFAQYRALRTYMPTTEDRRKAAIRSFLHSQTAPNANASSTQNSEAITWHKHWVFLVRGVAWPCLLWLVAFLGWLLSSLLTVRDSALGLASLFGWLTLVLTPICLVWALYNWEDWRNDIYKLDHEHVYEIERLPFGLREQAKQTLVTKVTDVTYNIRGPLGHLLDYGDVVLKTPGEAIAFTFRRIPHPREAQQEIMKRVEEYRVKNKATSEGDIQAWLKAYYEVQGQDIEDK